MRECIVNREDLRAMYRGRPEQLVRKLKAAGFVLERESSPVKIRQPWSMVGSADGTLLYRQEEA